MTIFDARPKPGGLNEYGIAFYKTPDGFAQAEVDYVLQYNATAALAAGVEAHAVPGVFSLRAGLLREVRFPSRTVPSFGAGVVFGAFRMDYAFRADPDGAFENQHHVALGARF